MVRVAVLLARGEVLGGDLRNVHVVWAIVIVNDTSSPDNSALGLVRITTGPDTNTDGHWGLGIPGATAVGGAVCVEQSAQKLSIVPPFQLVFVPPGGVVVVRISGGFASQVVGETGVRQSYAFAKVVRLHLSVLRANPFPVDFVKIV